MLKFELINSALTYYETQLPKKHKEAVGCANYTFLLLCQGEVAKEHLPRALLDQILFEAGWKAASSSLHKADPAWAEIRDDLAYAVEKNLPVFFGKQIVSCCDDCNDETRRLEFRFWWYEEREPNGVVVARVFWLHAS